jgi:hypothetical protein
VLYANQVDRLGNDQLPVQLAYLPDAFTLTSVGGSEGFHLVRVVSPSADGVTLKTVGASEDSLYLRDFDNGGGGIFVPVPGLIGEAALARLGARDWLATTSLEGEAVSLELRVLAPRGDYSTTTNDAAQVVVRIPLGLHRETVRRVRPFAVTPVDGRLVLVWVEQSKDGVAMRALSFDGETLQPSAPVTLAVGIHSAKPVNAWVRGSGIIVPVLDVVEDPDGTKSPLAVVLDPGSLAITSRFTANEVRKLRLLECSWDTDGCLALVSTGWLGSSAVGKKLAMGSDFGPLGEAQLAQALPGGRNAQRSPRSTCRGDRCLLAWSDTRSDPYGRPRAIRIATGSAQPVDSTSFELFSAIADPNSPIPMNEARVVATASGFLATSAQCASIAEDKWVMELVVQAIPRDGGTGTHQVLRFDDVACGAWTDLALTPTPTGAIALLLMRDLDRQLVAAKISGEGVPARWDLSVPDATYWYDAVDVAVVGETATIALRQGQFWTTAPASLNEGAVAPTLGLNMECPSADCPQGPRRLVSLPGRQRPSWLELKKGAPWTVQLSELDEAGRPVGAARVLAQTKDDMFGLEVSVEERGFSTLTAERSWTSEPYDIVLRRFDAEGALTSERTVASGISTLGHSLSSCGNGQWLSAFSAAGNQQGTVIHPGAPESRVFGRFIYEAPTTVVGPSP